MSVSGIKKYGVADYQCFKNGNTQQCDIFGCNKYNFHLNTSTKVTCHNFDDLVPQCYWVWGDMTSITV